MLPYGTSALNLVVVSGVLWCGVVWCGRQKLVLLLSAAWLNVTDKKLQFSIKWRKRLGWAHIIRSNISGK